MGVLGKDVEDQRLPVDDVDFEHLLQVALLRYNMPRLRGKGMTLSQQTGGIGARRGPGETKLETDRRRIEQRISRLERELIEVNKVRRTQSKSRRRSEVPVVSLVGYTNADKSTLLNHLTDAGVLAEDQLFSTLDSTVRRFQLPDGRPILISDTVGFVRRLPHHLVEAFRSTLEEVKQADLLVHLVDSSDAEPEEQIAAVHEVLEQIGASQVPELLVLNMTDAVDASTIARLQNLHPEAVPVSALKGTGIDLLVEALSEHLVSDVSLVRLEIPYSRADIVAAAHREGEVVAEKHEETGSVLEVRLSRARLPLFEQFVTG